MLISTVIFAVPFQLGYQHRSPQCNPKSLIQIITDGTGPASYTMARDYIKSFGKKEELFSDQFVVGMVKTHSYNSLVTDSAAGATALASMTKTNNGYIGVDHNGTPVPTILEAAKLKGMTTGIVVTSTITHATPAGFYAHVLDRGWEDVIAQQLITGTTALNRTVDLIIGGGLEFFLPNSSSPIGRRTDGRNLLKEAKQHGWSTVVNNSKDFWSSNLKLPVLAPLTTGHMPFEIDRNSTQFVPSLKQMVEKALPLLYKKGQSTCQGFFLMIEASRIDHAGHSNDAAAHVHDMLAYQDMLAYVHAFVNKNSNNILVVSTSDHETGGFTLANGDHSPYRYYPTILRGVVKSTEIASQELLQLDTTTLKAYIVKTFGLDITDAENQMILEAYKTSKIQDSWYPLMRALSLLINTRAEIGATTHGHSAVDVPLIVFGNDDNTSIKGIMENTAMSRKLWTEYYKFDFEKLKDKLRHQNVHDPQGRIPAPEKRHCV